MSGLLIESDKRGVLALSDRTIALIGAGSLADDPKYIGDIDDESARAISNLQVGIMTYRGDILCILGESIEMLDLAQDFPPESATHKALSRIAGELTDLASAYLLG